MRAIPIAEENHGLEGGVIHGRVGKQEEYMSIVAPPLTQPSETVPATEEGPVEGGGDSQIISHVQDEEGEEFEKCVGHSASPFKNTHIKEALLVTEEGARLEGRRDSLISSHFQNDEQDEYASISEATSLAQLHIEEAVPATDQQDVPGKENEGDVALFCHGQEHEQEEYVSISVLPPCDARTAGTARSHGHVTVKAHLQSSQHCD